MPTLQSEADWVRSPKAPYLQFGALCRPSGQPIKEGSGAQSARTGTTPAFVDLCFPEYGLTYKPPLSCANGLAEIFERWFSSFLMMHYAAARRAMLIMPLVRTGPLTQDIFRVSEDSFFFREPDATERY